jgi:CspA family cold shock protein
VSVPQGTVRWFDAERGFGFLAPDDGEDVFVHASEIVGGDGGSKLLREGQAVEFEVGEGDRGPQARRVRVTGEMAPGSPVGVLGSVAWYEPGKGYGFVAPDDGGPEIFVHSSAVVAGGVLVAGQRVAFLVAEGERGPQAEHVLPLGADSRQPGAHQPGAHQPAAHQPGPDDGADGTVSWFDLGKGFGFVTPESGGEDVFVHVRALAGGLASLSEGDRVTYQVVHGDKGPQARDLRLVRGTGARAVAARPAPARPAQARTAEASARAGEGVVARFDAERGFGFITPDAGGPDLFVHVSVLGGAGALLEGERVRYKVRQSDRGPQADRVERV